jgi:hypothetical protein
MNIFGRGGKGKGKGKGKNDDEDDNDARQSQGGSDNDEETNASDGSSSKVMGMAGRAKRTKATARAKSIWSMISGKVKHDPTPPVFDEMAWMNVDNDKGKGRVDGNGRDYEIIRPLFTRRKRYQFLKEWLDEYRLYMNNRKYNLGAT